MRFTVPYRPPPVITFVPSCSEFWNLRISFCRFYCGRIINSHTMAKIATIMMSIPIPPPPALLWALNRIVFIFFVFIRFICYLFSAFSFDGVVVFSATLSAAFSLSLYLLCFDGSIAFSIFPVEWRYWAMESSIPLMYPPLFGVE